MSFHVPNEWRVRTGDMGSHDAIGNMGAFVIPCRQTAKGQIVLAPKGNYYPLTCIASDQAGWEHVSFRHERRVPTWEEACFIKALFWDPDDCVVQYHPPEENYVNVHANVLHLWKPTGFPFPMPPQWMV